MPSNAKMHINLGQAYFVLDRMEKSLEHYSKAAALEPQNPRLNYYFGGAFLKMADYETALEYLKTGVQKTPKDQEMKLLYAKAQSQKTAFESAFQEAMQRHEENPQHPAAQYELGRLNAVKRRFDPATVFFSFCHPERTELSKKFEQLGNTVCGQTILFSVYFRISINFGRKAQIGGCPLQSGMHLFNTAKRKKSA